jgi:hypothetical protein
MRRLPLPAIGRLRTAIHHASHERRISLTVRSFGAAAADT